MMNDDLDPRAAEVTERLRALGAQPVDPPLASAHLTAIASVRPAGRLRQRLAVAGALFAGTLIGSTGLAAAGALPRTMQDVAQSALAKVNVEVPGGTERYDGPECVGDTPARNRGQYLKQERAKGKEAFAAAKATKCGMPLSALDGDDEQESEEQAAEAKDKAAKDKAKAAKDKADDADTDESTATTEASGKPEEPGKSECVDRGQGNSGGLGKANQPEEPGQPADPGRPEGAGKPDETGKPDEPGQPGCTVPTLPEQSNGQGPVKDDDRTTGKPDTVPPANANGNATDNPSTSVRPS